MDEPGSVAAVIEAYTLIAGSAPHWSGSEWVYVAPDVAPAPMRRGPMLQAMLEWLDLYAAGGVK
jgi:hypothetical protein